MELLKDDAVWLSLQVLVVHTSLQYTRYFFAVSLQWFVVLAYFVYEWCGVRFDCRECAFFLCEDRCESIGFAGRLQCTGSHVPSPEVRFLCRCAAFRVFCVRADCVQQCCIFLQRRALLPIIETQKSPC